MRRALGCHRIDENLQFGAMLVLIAPLFLSGCSKTVQWEEEVPLNTGETIWIERSMPWARQGGFGNPLVVSMLPTREQTIRFTYAGKEYVYSGRANVRWIAVSPTKQPVLVAPAADYGWYTQNNYYCVVPYYVQLIPDEIGRQWTWPEKIESWLYNMPANVMASIPDLEERRQARYTARERDQRDATYRLQFREGARIAPLYKAGTCITKFEVDMNNRPEWTGR